MEHQQEKIHESPPKLNNIDVDSSPVDSEITTEGAEVALLLARFMIVFGGAIPFIPQYFTIMRTEDASGFSTKVCMVVVVSSVLRIAYWFGREFDIALLYQSVLMIFGMMVVLDLCLRVERKKAEDADIPFQEHYFLDFEMGRFWQWTDLASYLQATAAMLGLSCAYAVRFAERDAFIEPLGFTALLIEACLAIPQFIRNYQNQSTQGMNIMMVIFWTIGDLVKGFFFFVTEQPLPFILCASIQLIMDFALFGQVFLYNDIHVTESETFLYE